MISEVFEPFDAASTMYRSILYSIGNRYYCIIHSFKSKVGELRRRIGELEGESRVSGEKIVALEVLNE